MFTDQVYVRAAVGAEPVLPSPLTEILLRKLVGLGVDPLAAGITLVRVLLVLCPEVHSKNPRLVNLGNWSDYCHARVGRIADIRRLRPSARVS